MYKLYTCGRQQRCQRTCDSRGKSKSAVGQRQDMSADTVHAQTHSAKTQTQTQCTDVDTACAQTETHSATCGSPPPSFHPLTSWSPASPLNGLLCSPSIKTTRGLLCPKYKSKTTKRWSLVRTINREWRATINPFHPATSCSAHFLFEGSSAQELGEGRR